MPTRETFNAPWTRKHDNPKNPLLASVPRQFHPVDLRGLIDFVATSNDALHACGTHWALSEAAISDHTFIETTNVPPADDQAPALNKTIHDVLPACLNSAYLEMLVEKSRSSSRESFTLAHIESGKKIFQLYAELDSTNGSNPTALTKEVLGFNPNAFAGPWAFDTLGGAAGQTIVGALSTGTHGGDFILPPVADSALALHLVVGNKKHYWIEPKPTNIKPSVIDKDKLKAKYPVGVDFPGIEIIFDDDIFNAVLVSVGRFGVIYSVVIKAVPQYLLMERRYLSTWNSIKNSIVKQRDSLFNEPVPSNMKKLVRELGGHLVIEPQRFLQIAVCLVPIKNGSDNQVGITKRWKLQHPGRSELGRDQRVGNMRPEVPGTSNAVFDMAGRRPGYKPDGDAFTRPSSSSILDIACQSASILVGLLEALLQEIEEFVTSGGAVLGYGLTLAAAGSAVATTLVPLLAIFAAALIALRELLKLFKDDTTLPEAIEQLREVLSNFGDTGIWIWRAAYNLMFESEQSEHVYAALSYAVMDQHSYGNHCEINVDSLDVFFDVRDTRLVSFVDSLIEFEKNQEKDGKTNVGYASLRFMQRTQALIGMQQFDTTVGIEVGCLRDVNGGDELLAHAMKIARDMNTRAFVHWGQSNSCTAEEIEFKFSMLPDGKADNLKKWKKSLSSFGRDTDRFSNEFTRRVGLEP